MDLSRRAATSTRLLIAVALVAGSGVVSTLFDAGIAQAAPAGTSPSAFTVSAPGAFSGTIPDGICAVSISALGGTGASSGLSATTGGAGGRAARIGATFSVLPGQAYSGAVAGGGQSNGTAGANGGGAGGTIGGGHRGGGGGGSTSFVVAGQTLVVAGGGGGGGAAHNPSPAGAGGSAGIVAVPGVGSGGTAGVDPPRTNSGGGGGTASAGGAGGVNSGNSAFNGSAGGGIGSGTGGNGGPDNSFDSAGGGGGGYTGGGGGASTVSDSVTGGGGGGGSSFIAAASPTAATTAPTGSSGSLGVATGNAAANGPNGSITADFIPCVYNLALSKSVSPAAVVRGDTVVWTVSVVNNGPDPMTKGDTIDLTDSLPGGPNGPASPAFKVLSVSTSGGSNASLASPILSCSGVTIGSAMPASTTCSRAYAAATGTPGSPTGGSRGLNVGETLTITYEQDIASSAPCRSTITNAATVVDRPTNTAGADIVGNSATDSVSAPLTISCQPKLTVAKALGGGRLSSTDQFTVAISPSGVAPTGGNTTTAGTGSSVTAGTGSSTVASAIAGLSYSFSESMATGSASALSQYRSAVTCVNATAGSSTVLPASGSTVVPFAITPATNDDITCTLTNSPLTSSLSIAKSTTSTGYSVVGATIPYSFTVTNTGQTTLQSITITDPVASGISCGATTLAPSASTTCTATRTVTQADLDAGSVVNRASVTGTPPGGSPIPSVNSNTVTVTGTQSPALTITKSTTKTSFAAVGETIPYSFAVRNTGNVTLSAVAVTDPKTAGVSCTSATLSPGQGTTCTGQHTVTLADLNAGSVVNTATVGATTPGGGSVGPVSSNQVTVPAVQNASLSVLKTSSLTSYSALNATVPYSVTVTNNGNVILTALSVTDAQVPSMTCASSSLEPGVSTTCTGSHTVTQADLDAGSIVNTASAVATQPNNTTIAPVASNTVTIPATSTPAISIIKSTTATTYSTIGTSVPYTFTVTNNGNVTLSSISVTDPKTSGVTCASTTLSPGSSTTCSGSHVVTQADLDAGSLANTAAVAALTPSGASVPSSPSNTVTISATQSPRLDVVKATSTASYNTLGATISYTFTVTNNGNVTVSAITVTDPKVPSVTCPATSLAPGAATVCSGSHIVTQADLDAGSVVNTASVGGTSPGGAALTPRASNTVTTPAVQSPTLSIVKASSTSSFALPGDTISYTFRVTNTGNVTMTGVTVTDPKVSGISCPSTSLIPGASTTCSGTRIATGSDVSAGRVVNTANVVATPPSGTAIEPVASNTVTVSLNTTPALSVSKTANLSSYSTVGQVISYSFVVTNTGNVAVTGLSVSDPRTSGVTCPVTSLTLRQSTTCTGSHTVTAADLDAGSIVNTASASATPVLGPPMTPVNSNTITIPASQTPSATITKQSASTSFSTVGVAVPYSFVVSNTGNVTLSSVAVDDPNASGVTCPSTTLVAGDSMTCSGSHTVTQADVDAGSLINTASVTGRTPSGSSIAPVASNTLTIPATQTASLSLVKRADAASFSAVGQSVPFTVTATNTGNVTLRSVTISDPMLSSISCGTSTLAPSTSTLCTGVHLVTQADLDAGRITNTASVTATPPSGTPTSPVSSNTVTVPAVQTARLELTKSTTDSGYATVGQTLDYTFVVRNAGNVTISAVAVTDPVVAGITCGSTSLAPLAQTTCTGSRVITQADLDAGSVINTASVTGNAPGGAAVGPVPSNTVTVPAVQSPSLTISKSTSNTSYAVVGERINYSFSVTNSGNVTITDVAVNDPVAGAVTCAPLTVAPGQSSTCSAFRDPTQADIDAGSVINTASVTGKRPDGAVLAPVSSNTVTVPANQNPIITIEKTTSTANYNSVNDSIAYSFTVTNRGNVTLSNVVISDPIVAGLTCVSTTLAPGASTLCSGTHTVTQADIDAGKVDNTARVSASRPNGTTLAPVPSNTVTVPAVQSPSMSIVKSTVATSFAAPGTTINYSFFVTNAGNVTMTSVAVIDPLLAGISCPTTTLAPGASTTCTGSHTTTQNDVDTGRVDNTASVTGTPPSGTPITPVSSNTVSVPATQTPALTITKAAGSASFSRINEEVPFTFSVTNSGNVTMTSVTVSDPGVVGLSCGASTLAPGVSTTCSAAHIVTAADLDAGQIANTASVVGTPIGGSPIAPVASNTVVVPGVQSPSLAVVKSTTTNSYRAAGNTITYSFVVTNTGNVTLSSVSISDPKLAGISCTPASIGAGQQSLCSGTHTVVQADVDAGSVVNTAAATATPPAGGTLAPVASNTVTVAAVQSPGIAITKSSSTANFSAVGQSVSYSFSVSNTGNVTLNSIAVTDTNTTGVTCLSTTLAVGSSTTCNGSHVVTQADLDRGYTVNTASVSALDPGNAPVGPLMSNTVTVPASVNPSLTINKAATGTNPTKAGDVVTYTFTIANNGNVTMTLIEVHDPKAFGLVCPQTVLAPAESTVCTGSHSVTQAEVDAGTVDNTSWVTAKPPVGLPIPPQVSNQVSVAIVPTPSMTLTKATTAPPFSTVGEVISYTFEARNTGNVTLTNVVVSDPIIGGMTCLDSTLVPGQSTNCVGSHAVTQADLDLGRVDNTATVSATTPTDAPVGPVASNMVTVNAVRSPSLTIEKSTSMASVAVVGTEIPYTFTVRNTGNVTLTDVAVADPKATGITCPSSTLAPGTALVCTGKHVVVLTDLDSGSVVNTASAVGTPPAGAPLPPTASNTVTVPVIQGPALSVAKSTTASSFTAVGDPIPYSFVVTNNGNVTMRNIAVVDPVAGTVTCAVSILAPTFTTTCTATRLATQADLDAGQIVNTASVTGATLNGDSLRPVLSNTVTVPAVVNSRLAVTKASSTTAVNALGQTVPFTFTVTNTGNVTMTAVSVSDPQAVPVTCAATTLAPSASTTCTGSHRVTQAELDAGEVVNTASVVGSPPSGPPTAPVSSNTVRIPATPLPSLSVAKSTGAGNYNAVGQAIDYSFLITNTGNVTMSNPSVTDAVTGPVTCPAGALAPGSTATCTASRIVTQDDLDAGAIVNVATATATPVRGLLTPAMSNTVTVPAAQGAAITITKASATSSVRNVGDTVEYTFTVRNTGNVTVNSIVVNDPQVSGVTCPGSSLRPGQQFVCLGQHATTQDEINSGRVRNVALVTAKSPSGADLPTIPSNEVVVPATRDPKLSIVKSAVDPDRRYFAGDKIGYRFLVANVGNVPLSDVLITDPLITAVTCPSTALAVGSSMTCTASLQVTIQDQMRSVIRNVATGDAKGPNGTVAPRAVSNEVTVTLPPPLQPAPANTNPDPVAPTAVPEISSPTTLVEPAPASSSIPVAPTSAALRNGPAIILKKSAPASFSAIGDVVTYLFVIANTGDTELGNVVLVDTMVGLSAPDCGTFSGTLAAGQSITCTATYTVTATDLSRGRIDNAAAVSASDLSGELTAKVLSDSKASTTRTVPEELPFTGGSFRVLLMVAGAFIAMGSLLLVGRRRTARN